MGVEPQVVSLSGFILIALGIQGPIEWHLSGDRPLIFENLGVLGDLLDVGSTLVLVAGGFSLIVWSFIKLPWYLPVVFFISSQVLVRIISIPIPLRAFFTSALTPILCAVGIVALHWFTWFATSP